MTEILDLEAERAVLGGLMADRRKFADVGALLKPADFGADAHRAIFQSLFELDSAGRPFDLLVVAEALKARGQLDRAGGVAYLSDLDTAAPSSANVVHYAKILADTAARRRLLGLAKDLAAKAELGKSGPVDLANETQQALSDAVQPATQGGLEVAAPIVERTLDLMDKLRKNGGGVTGVATGFLDLDKQLTGLHEGELLILAARPGMGKTALGMNIAAHVALRGAKPVAVFSLEMPSEQLMLRLMAAEGRVPLKALREGGLSDYHMGGVNTASAALYAAPLHIDDTAAVSLFDLRSRLRRLVQKSGPLGLVVIDYLQLMGGSGGHHGSREQEVAANSRGLKQIAKELKVPILALAQLSRKIEERKGGRPMLSDLRESGSIEQDADVVMFIHREIQEDPETGRESNSVELVVAKQRNGPVGSVPLTWLPECVKFESRGWAQ